MSPTDGLDERASRRLIDVGRSLLSELDLEAVLDRVLETAAELTGARYAALGVLDEERRELERFLTRGIDEATHRAIGDLPRGRGVLGVLIDDPRPLRLADVGEHPRSYGFPPGHPPMATFLGVPILIRGEAWGNLYLTEKAGGERSRRRRGGRRSCSPSGRRSRSRTPACTRASQRGATSSSAPCGASRRRRRSRAPSARETELDARARAGRQARRGRSSTPATVVHPAARRRRARRRRRRRHVDAGTLGARSRWTGSVAGEVLRRGRAASGSPTSRARLRVHAAQLGVAAPTTALLVPLVFRGRALGVLARVRPARRDGRVRRRATSSCCSAFAAQRGDRRRDRADGRGRAPAPQRSRAAEAERRRWARELHDETLQALGGARRCCSSPALRARRRRRARAGGARRSSSSSSEIANAARADRRAAPAGARRARPGAGARGLAAPRRATSRGSRSRRRRPSRSERARRPSSRRRSTASSRRR